MKKVVLPFLVGVTVAGINLTLILCDEVRVVVVIDFLFDRVIWLATKKPMRHI